MICGVHFLCFGLLFLHCYVVAEEDQRHHFNSQQGHLNEIPKRFQVKGDINAITEFTRYINDIAGLSEKNNVSIMYKVKVDIMKPYKKSWLVKKQSLNHKNPKSKKFNVPLKKNSMKLSRFEKIMRKIADENIKKDQGKKYSEDDTTRASIPQTQATKIPHSGKYKPIIGILRKKFNKHVKPVRTNVITLT